jgi:hypothetical protein
MLFKIFNASLIVLVSNYIGGGRLDNNRVLFSFLQ